MSTNVITRSVCDLCGLVDEREGALGGSVPPLWSRVVITERLSESSLSVTREVCLRCAEAIDIAINNIAEAAR